MKEVEVKTEIGTIKYKTPNVPQRLRLLSKLGVSFDEASSEVTFDTLADIIEHIDNLIVSVDIKLPEGNIDSWEACIDEEECMAIVLQVATQIVMPTEKPKAKARKARVKKS